MELRNGEHKYQTQIQAGRSITACPLNQSLFLANAMNLEHLVGPGPDKLVLAKPPKGHEPERPAPAESPDFQPSRPADTTAFLILPEVFWCLPGIIR